MTFLHGFEMLVLQVCKCVCLCAFVKLYLWGAYDVHNQTYGDILVGTCPHYCHCRFLLKWASIRFLSSVCNVPS